MTAAAVATVKSTEDAVNGTAQVFDLFDSAPTAGNTLILVTAIDGSQTQDTDPTGFTLLNYVSHTGGNVSGGVWWKKATGTGEDSGTLSWTSGGNERSAHVLFEISGAADPTVTVPEETNAEGTTTSDADSPTITPTGGPKDFLYLSVACIDRGNREPTGFPSGYGDTGTQGTPSSTANGASLGWGALGILASSSTDPGAFSHGNDEWVAFTIAIHPAPAVGSADAIMNLMQYGNLGADLYNGTLQ